MLNGHTDQVAGVAFAPNGSRLATASWDKTARIWSVGDGKCVQTSAGHANKIRCVAWSPDGALLAIGAADRSIKLWNSEGAVVRSIENLDDGVWSICFSSDSSECTHTLGGISGNGRGAAVLKVPSGEQRIRFTQHDNSVYSGAISPDGTIAATAGGNCHEIYLWSLKDGRSLRHLVGKGKPNWSAGWSLDGKGIAWGTTYNGKSIHDRFPLERTFSPVKLELGSSADTGYRRAAESVGSLSLKRVDSTSLELKQQDAVVAKIAPVYRGERILSFSFVKGDHVAVGGDYGLYLFDPRTGAKLREFQGHTSPVWAVVSSPDGRYLLSASWDQTLRIWDPARDTPVLSLFFAGDDWIAWTPEGYYAASPGGENLMGWHLSNGPDKVATFAPASQFHKTLYRPDVIKLLLGTGSVAAALERLNEQVKPIADVIPPAVIITSPGRNGERIKDKEITIRAMVSFRRSNPVKAMRLLVNGRPYEGEQGRKDVPNDADDSLERTEAWQVRLDPGRHRLKVVAEGRRQQWNVGGTRDHL